MKSAAGKSAASATTRDSVLAKLMEDYLASCEAGQPLTADELAARYPELTNEVAACLASLDFIRQAASSAVGNALCGVPSIRGDTPAGQLGDFRILREIGRGGMGVVYEAEQISLQRRVALKVLPFASVLDAKQLARFKNEALAAAQLDHPHIVDVLGVGCDRGTHFYAMRYIEGCTLADAIHDLRRVARLEGQESGARSQEPDDPGTQQPEASARESYNNLKSEICNPQSATTRPLTGLSTFTTEKSLRSQAYFRKVADLIAAAADALHRAHEQGIIHRDIKPSNLLLDQQGKLWITDFGLAHMETGAALTMTGELLGTLRYMSPEQVLGRPASIDQRTDIYSLGVTLYELATLQPACRGDSRQEVLRRVVHDDPEAPRKLAPAMPRDLETVILKALEKDPSDRYSTAAELAGDLRRFLGDRPIQARPATALERLGKWARRHRAMVRTAALAAVSLLAVIASVAIWTAWVASARQQALQRETLIQQVQLQRLLPHSDGWFDGAWNRVIKARQITADLKIRSEAAAILAGLEARVEKDMQTLPASSVALSPSGRLLAVGGTCQTTHHPSRGATLWDTQTWQQLQVTPHHGPGLVGFRGETAVQLVARDGPALLLWDVTNQQALRELRFLAGADGSHAAGLLVNELGCAVTALSADALLVAAAARWSDGSEVVAAWDAASGEQLFSQTQSAASLAWSLDRRRLAIGDREGRISVWSLPEEKKVAAFAAGRATIHSLAFSPDHRLLAIGGSEGLLSIWDWEKAIPVSQCRGSIWDVFSVAFSPDRVTLASAGRNRGNLWDVATGRPLLQLSSRDRVSGLVFGKDGQHLVCSAEGGFNEGGVRIWKLDSGRGIQTLRGLDSQITQFWFSPDDKLLAALSQNWRLAVWEVQTQRLLCALDAPRGSSADNASLAFSPDGRSIVFSTSGEARQWETATGRELHTWKLPPALQDQLAFHSAGRLLLVREEMRDGRPITAKHDAQNPRVLRIRDLLADVPLTPLGTIEDFPYGAFPVLLAPNGQHLVVLRTEENGLHPRTVKVFDALTQRVTWSYTAPRDVFLRLDPRGTVLAIPDGQQTTWVELPSGKLLAAAPVVSHNISPDGILFLLPCDHQPDQEPFGYSLCRRGEAEPLVNLALGQEPYEPKFNQAGRLLAHGNADGSVSVHDLQEIQRRLAAIGLGW